MTYLGEISAFAAAICWTMTAINFEIAGKEVGANTVNIMKLVISFLILTLMLMVTKNDVFLQTVSPESWVYLMISGVIGFVLGDIFLIKAFILIGSRISLLIMSSVPPISAILGYLVFGEVLSLYSVIGMIITIFGISVVLVVKDSNKREIKLSHPIKGIVYALIGAFGQAVGLIFSKLGMGDLNILVATQVRMIAGIIGLVIIFMINKEFYKIKNVFKSKKVMISILIGSFFGSTLGVVFSLLAIKYTAVGVASTIMALAPILVIPISIKVFHEKVGRKAILGAFIAILGVTVLVFA